MSLKSAQKEVDDWAQQFKPPYWQPLEQLARLTEELGELAKELNIRFGAKRKKPTDDTKEVSDELMDVIFTAICLANSLNIDLDDAFVRVMAKVRGRDKDVLPKK